MSVQEKLARLQPKTQSYTDSGGGFGGLTAADIAAGLTGSSPLGEFIVWFKYVGSEPPGYGKGTLIKLSVERIASKLGGGNGLIPELLDIALDGYAGHHKCPECHGKSKIIINGLEHNCPSRRCVDGHIRINAREVSKMLKVRYQDYLKLYARSYNEISKMLDEILPEQESQALSTLFKNINFE